MRLLLSARNQAVAVQDRCIVEAEGPFDAVLQVGDADARPGLINAHDHLHRNHYGRLGTPPYANASGWAQDIQSRYRFRITKGRRLPRRDALLAGAWKNLFAGVTTVVHHDRWEPDFEQDFPLRVLSVPNADSLSMTPVTDLPDGDRPFCLHVAEGLDAQAAGEACTLEAMGLLTPALVAVHGVGLDDDGIRRFRAAGAAIVWCPTSNLFLFGRTAPPALLAEGIDVLLGSDSLLTGAGDLLMELQCARRLRILSDARLEEAVGPAPARRFGIDAPSLAPGSPADIILLTRPLLEARADDVVLVMVGGIPRVARPDLAPALERLGFSGCARRIGSVLRWTCSAMSMECTKGREQEDDPPSEHASDPPLHRPCLQLPGPSRAGVRAGR